VKLLTENNARVRYLTDVEEVRLRTETGETHWRGCAPCRGAPPAGDCPCSVRAQPPTPADSNQEAHRPPREILGSCRCGSVAVAVIARLLIRSQVRSLRGPCGGASGDAGGLSSSVRHAPRMPRSFGAVRRGFGVCPGAAGVAVGPLRCRELRVETGTNAHQRRTLHARSAR
jgi:hypothetical protein